MSKVGEWIRNTLKAIGTVFLVGLMALCCLGSPISCAVNFFRTGELNPPKDYVESGYSEEDYSLCDECDRKVLSDDLIPVEYGKENVCAQCIEIYSRCIVCKSFRHADDMMDETHCYDCVDYIVVDYTSKGTPVVEVFNSIRWTKTEGSEAFSEISYDKDKEILYVRFRDSGAAYRYLDFPFSSWKDFVTQSSLGNWYNANIKGHYECQKIYE